MTSTQFTIATDVIEFLRNAKHKVIIKALILYDAGNTLVYSVNNYKLQDPHFILC